MFGANNSTMLLGEGVSAPAVFVALLGRRCATYRDCKSAI